MATQGPSDTIARSSQLLPGDLDTDADDDRDFTAEQIIEITTAQAEEKAAIEAAAQQTSETERQQEGLSTSRW